MTYFPRNLSEITDFDLAYWPRHRSRVGPLSGLFQAPALYMERKSQGSLLPGRGISECQRRKVMAGTPALSGLN